VAEKHEARPTRDNKTAFRKVVQLGSASSWTAFNLDLFQVHFDQHTYSNLPDVVLKYNAEDNTEEGLRKIQT
jgi:hypothetical protein